MPTRAEIEANRRIWDTALRSDKYKQGRKRLFYDDEYCCLGVGVKELTGKDPSPKHPWCDGFGYLNTVGLHALGLFIAEMDMLVVRNDEGTSFPEIADIIETLPIHGADDE